MTKQELLTRLAKECASWKEVARYAKRITESYNFECKDNAITKQDWLAERERLINKPQWKYAPSNARYLAFDDFTKQWDWYYSTVFIFRCANGSKIWHTDGWTCFASEPIAIPAGYDWRHSLEERPA